MKYSALILLSLLCHQLSAQNLVVQATYTNVLYVGLDNELVIRYNGIKDKNLFVKTDGNGTIKHLKDATYFVTVNPNSKKCKIYIGLKKSNRRKWLDSLELEIKLIPKPIVRFGNLKTQYCTIQDLLTQDSLTCQQDAYVRNLNYSVSKYRLIIMPKRGPMKEYIQMGPQINDKIKTAIAGCDEGDLLVIDGIRAIGPFGERQMDLLIINIVNYHDTWEQFGRKRIVGYYLDSGLLKLYKYPIIKDQVDCSYKLRKDSLWTYWIYNNSKKDFLKSKIDSFKNGYLIQSTYFHDTTEIKHYLLRTITDSTFFYTSYYSNGNIYQKGIVCINTPRTKYRKYYFYESDYLQIKEEKWELHLKNIEQDLFPIGLWEVYDSLQNLKINLNYQIVRDQNPPTICYADPVYPTLENFHPIHFYIIPDGPCIIYENGKVKETIVFKDGKIVSRK